MILIQVESLGNHVIGKKIEGQEITPNLNKLVSQAHYFKKEQFVLGAGHTSDTDYVSTSSFWPLFDSSVFIRYAKDAFFGLPKDLRVEGYQSFAYHAYNRNFWNRSVALKSLGFERFYAMENYPKGPAINMGGLADREFMAKTFEYLKQKPQKSLNYIITLSSHYPFQITAQTNGLKINPEAYPAFVGGYLENINYTDAALGDLFELLRKNQMYDDSLIIVYGDHNPVMNNFTAGDLSFDLNSAETKTVPLIIKLPGQAKSQIHNTATTHLDIAPTVLDLLGIKTERLMFGASVFDRSYGSRRCSDGFIVPAGKTNDCENQKNIQKTMAAKIIKYNLFPDLTR